MSNRSLSSLNKQQLNGNVRRLSNKFEGFFEIKIKSNKQLEYRNKTQILTSSSDTNANTNHSLNESSTSPIDRLLNLLSNKELIRIFKQVLAGGSIGTLVGFLLGQTSQFFL